ncbi:type II toxin-antitoxin system RelE/ParE family toxin [Novosphingopyxis sp.]|uniref:type II toxin-antitoxin system RelE/ParE family toxin n=1 Tax=Novosphingopyxis sp. TaxID=2709690 RepID=UPI003B5949D0
MLTVVETPEFVRRSEKIGLNDIDRTELIVSLASDPEQGMPLGGGLRKARVARTGQGKSGGYRLLFFYRHPGLPLFLLTIFAKNEKANISVSERRQLIDLCALIAREYEDAR